MNRACAVFRGSASRPNARAGAREPSCHYSNVPKVHQTQRVGCCTETHCRAPKRIQPHNTSLVGPIRHASHRAFHPSRRCGFPRLLRALLFRKSSSAGPQPQRTLQPFPPFGKTRADGVAPRVRLKVRPGASCCLATGRNSIHSNLPKFHQTQRVGCCAESHCRAPKRIQQHNTSLVGCLRPSSHWAFHLDRRCQLFRFP